MIATYTAYEHLNTPNEVIEKMCEFVTSKGYEIVADLQDDNDIYDNSVIDGKKFTFMDKSYTYYVNMRSQNGYNIFGLNNEIEQANVNKANNTDERYSGVGMVVSEQYDEGRLWYNQTNAPIKYNSNAQATTDVLGVYMPVPKGKPIPEVLEPEVVEEPEEVSSYKRSGEAPPPRVRRPARPGRLYG